MKILSWDIGIKNLSYCLVSYIDNEIKIISWEIINLVSDDKKKEKIICQGFLNNGSTCTKEAKSFNSNTLVPYCKVHSKKFNTELVLEIKNNTCSHYLKNKDSRCPKKIVWETSNPLVGYCGTHYKKYNPDDLKKKVKKKKNENFDDISIKLIQELDQREFLQDADIILIENQPALKNPKMKSIQMLVYSYFLIRSKIDKNNLTTISFLLANNKLKVKLDDLEKNNLILENNKKIKDKYKRRKELAKDYCLYYLENNITDKKWLDIYQSHKKKDDLADTFLMNVYKIQN